LSQFLQKIPPDVTFDLSLSVVRRTTLNDDTLSGLRFYLNKKHWALALFACGRIL